MNISRKKKICKVYLSIKTNFYVYTKYTLLSEVPKMLTPYHEEPKISIYVYLPESNTYIRYKINPERTTVRMVKEQLYKRNNRNLEYSETNCDFYYRMDQMINTQLFSTYDINDGDIVIAVRKKHPEDMQNMNKIPYRMKQVYDMKGEHNRLKDLRQSRNGFDLRKALKYEGSQNPVPQNLPLLPPSQNLPPPHVPQNQPLLQPSQNPVSQYTQPLRPALPAPGPLNHMPDPTPNNSEDDDDAETIVSPASEQRRTQQMPKDPIPAFWSH